MFDKDSIKHSSKLAIDGEELHQLAIELNEQKQEIISDGNEGSRHTTSTKDFRQLSAASDLVVAFILL